MEQGCIRKNKKRQYSKRFCPRKFQIVNSKPRPVKFHSLPWYFRTIATKAIFWQKALYEALKKYVSLALPLHKPYSSNYLISAWHRNVYRTYHKIRNHFLLLQMAKTYIERCKSGENSPKMDAKQSINVRINFPSCWTAQFGAIDISGPISKTLSGSQQVDITALPTVIQTHPHKCTCQIPLETTCFYNTWQLEAPVRRFKLFWPITSASLSASSFWLYSIPNGLKPNDHCLSYLTNGQIERCISALLARLYHHVSEYGKDWDTYTQPFTHA